MVEKIKSFEDIKDDLGCIYINPLYIPITSYFSRKYFEFKVKRRAEPDSLDSVWVFRFFTFQNGVAVGHFVSVWWRVIYTF